MTLTPSPEATDGLRRWWIGVLARADADALRAAMAVCGPLPPVDTLRAAEPGLIMVRGRMGGDGGAFNLGEMTVTRCSVVVAGFTGHAMVSGRDAERARNAAVMDALLQDAARRDALIEQVVRPLAAAEAERREARARAAAATRVDFFTVARGEDPA
ncbi:MAG: phosphonate C-P lyase system protein PhnG [Hyphomicrobiales bacterium]|nr:phosphonate C-P lyase system protein PhnG [Hyphomicrobiales bacterium]